MKFKLIMVLCCSVASADTITYNIETGEGVTFNFAGENVSLITGDTGGVNPTDCSNHQPPAGVTRVDSTYQAVTTEATHPDGYIFGYAHAQQASFGLNKNHYISILVTAPDELKEITIGFENAEANFTTAPYTASVSKCPGDFNVAGSNNSGGSDVGYGLCAKTGGAISLRFTTTLTPDSLDETFKCILNRGEPYYLNIIHSIQPPYTASICADPIECGVLFVERSQF